MKKYPDLTVRYADFLKEKTLVEAFKGGKKLVLVSFPGIDDQRIKAHTHAINAALSAGITHVYYTSLAFTSPSKTHVMLAHTATEHLLASLQKSHNLTFTAIREGIYAESFPLYHGFWQPGEREVVVAVGDGAVSWALRDELGEATARIVVDERGKWDNKIVTLTGPESIALSQSTHLLSSILGEDITFKIVSKDEHVKRFGNRGDFVAKWVKTHDGIVEGEAGHVTGTLEEVLGRRPGDFESYLREELGDVVKAKKGLQGGVETYSL
ncbi:hypothetical protein HDV00_007273 [Rhizophlyctis rosea]|nr:hypothetical protein HDV00_007273 [Rhizophlyctis rosea]